MDNIFIHFFDKEVLDLFDIKHLEERIVLQEFRFSFRLGLLLCNKTTIIPASNYMESPYAQGILNEHNAFGEFGYITLVSSSLNVSEFLEKKREQYEVNKESHPYYFASYDDAPVISTPSIWLPRKYRATTDIAASWLENMGDKVLWMSMSKYMKCSNINEFEEELAKIPERLQGSAFVAEHVLPLINWKGVIPYRVKNQINVIITRAYIKSFLDEFDAVCLTGLSCFDTSIILPLGKKHLPVSLIKRILYKGKLLNYVYNASSNELLYLKHSEQWNLFMRNVIIPIINSGDFGDHMQRIDFDFIGFLDGLEGYHQAHKYKEKKLMKVKSPDDEEAEATTSESLTDVVIITALQKERDAFLKYLNYPQEEKTKDRTFYRASISTKKSNSSYQVVLLSLPSMGNNQAAIATHHAISAWNPAYIILAGIAGGIKRGTDRYLGDIVVGEQIVYYEPGKQTESGLNRRYEVYRPAKVLLDAAKNLPHEDWAMSIHTNRPDASTGRIVPRVHFGVVMSGEKVITDSAFVDELRSDWSQMIAVEMEGAGSALAAYESHMVPGILLVKSICDWANAKKNDKWQLYAAEAVACFVVELLRSEPFDSKLKPQPIRTDIRQYTGKVKIRICQRLGNDWQNLADYFDIPLHYRNRFAKGREPQEIWEWLEQRNKLSGLEDALEFIDRDDLLEEFHDE